MNPRVKIVIAIGFVFTMTLLSTLAQAGSSVLRPSRFESTGDHIGDWYWLRSQGHTAVWTFQTSELRSARAGSVYLNFTPLVTNRLNGGSGYDVGCRVTVQGSATQLLTIPLSNPFRPLDPDPSGGIGYAAYGHSSTAIPSTILNGAEQITVTVSYPFRPDYHLAVNRDSMVIGYGR